MPWPKGCRATSRPRENATSVIVKEMIKYRGVIAAALLAMQDQTFDRMVGLGLASGPSKATGMTNAA